MKSLFIIIGHFLSVLNKFIPKNDKCIVFYSNLGFRDNVKALYDYTLSNVDLSKYQIIVSTNDWKTISHDEGVKYVNCYIGVFYFLTSKYFFYSFGKYPIIPSKHQMVINLWHGMPLKKIGNMEAGKENNKYDYFSYVISTSSFFNPIMMKSFNCDKNRILNVGQPRTDEFFRTNEYCTKQFKAFDKIVIWMPTFRVTDILHERNSSSDNLLPIISSQKEFNLLDDFLHENNYCLLIKFHPIQSLKKSFVVNTNNIKIIDEQYLKHNDINLYELLSYTDFLITDYSSVYFDYLLLNKPIVFTTDDVLDYQANRGFVVPDPSVLQPGEHVDSFDSLINAIRIIGNGQDSFIEERLKLNNVLNEFSTTNNCKTILNICGIDEMK